MPLHAAVRRGDRREVAALLRGGADLHGEDDERDTPLAAAIAANDGAMVGLLLRRGADPRRLGGRGGNPLRRAVAYFADRALRALVRSGHRFERDEILEALDWPNAWDRPSMVRSLLDAGYDLAVDPPPERMVAFLVELEGPRMLRLLLERGLDPDGLTVDREPVLVAATRQVVRGSVLPVVLARARQVDAPDRLGRTPLMWCAMHGHRAGVRRLLAAGADPTQRDTLGRTAAEWAASEGHDTIVRLLARRMPAGWRLGAGLGEWERRPTGADGLHGGGLALVAIQGSALEWIAGVPDWDGRVPSLVAHGLPMRRGRSGPFLLLRGDGDNRPAEGFLPPSLLRLRRRSVVARKGDRLLLRQCYSRLANPGENDPAAPWHRLLGGEGRRGAGSGGARVRV